MKNITILFFALSLSGMACAGSHGDQVRDARLDQAEAQSHAETAAVGSEAKVDKQETDSAYHERGQEIAASNQPGEQDVQKLNGLSKERADYEDDAQARLDKLGVRIDTAKQKIAILGVHAPSSLATDLRGAQEEHGLIKQEIMNLSHATADQWDAVKKRVDHDLSDLDTRIDDLSDKISDV